MAKLLVSVRSAEEALAALVGGADLIDVKEPARGAMGKSDDDTIAAVIEAVAGRVPVSAAMGEWVELDGAPPHVGLTFAKWGLSGIRGPSLEKTAVEAIRRAADTPVMVAYADCIKAGSPDPLTLARLAVAHRFPALLLDTFDKSGSTLLDWWPVDDLSWLIDICRSGGVPVALAGSLDCDQIRAASRLKPDWFAVRGAACEGGRGGTVSADRVAALKALVTVEG